jgi:putative tryptophan/tyrosine transport system substrate-binding protein
MARDRVARTRRQFVQGSLTLAGLVLLSGCGLAAPPRTAPKRAARVGFLTPASPQAAAPNLEAFREGMRAHGFEEGQDYVLEVRYAEGSDKRLPDLAAELITLPVDVLLASTLIANIAATSAG